jgi:hypothetical protein
MYRSLMLMCLVACLKSRLARTVIAFILAGFADWTSVMVLVVAAFKKALCRYPALRSCPNCRSEYRLGERLYQLGATTVGMRRVGAGISAPTLATI